MSLLCDRCHQSMAPHIDECIGHFVMVGGDTLDPVRFGDETQAVEGERCPSCHVRRGQRHHMNCPIEECPGCRKRVLRCECQKA